MNATKANRNIYFYITQGGLCYYCKKALWNGTELLACSIDHKIPTSRGGKDVLENTCLACVQCNGSKGNLMESEVVGVFKMVSDGKIKQSDVTDYVKYLSLKGKFGELSP